MNILDEWKSVKEADHLNFFPHLHIRISMRFANEQLSLAINEHQTIDPRAPKSNNRPLTYFPTISFL